MTTHADLSLTVHDTPTRDFDLSISAYDTLCLQNILATRTSTASADLSVPPLVSSDTVDHVEGNNSQVDDEFCTEFIDPREIDFGSSCQRIGHGSVSWVYKAKYQGRYVAVKMLRNDIDDKGQRDGAFEDLCCELAIVAELQHPNISKFVGAAKITHTGAVLPSIIYEYMGGGSIEKVFKTKNHHRLQRWKPPRDLVLSWSRQLFSALAYLHSEANLAHRDIKPANVLVTADIQTLKLADFSLSAPLHKPAVDKGTAISIAGSKRYMAPELYKRNSLTPDPSVLLVKADIYSAALTCYYFTAGNKPFHTFDVEEAVRHASMGSRPSLRDADLGTVLSIAWAACPSTRPSAAQLAQRFEQLLLAEKSRSKWWGKNLVARLRSSQGGNDGSPNVGGGEGACKAKR
mmetsp:Transcript_25580/g.52030  ORF Transcript_25580/g.52030 Transcript_25580/m.52030 type:complete len:403 (-) Transcript_25580:22-1230(-)|eukprot:CAMPEP_0181313872 /NCGR_PEP_ID=MMETSP1101-20121128/14493_1 /TAXON_ID=46948 /ORGANISM="Rhodomonas abbreviata, Strain Caron Lab Isolate" /LENGTH=402 /DNA_ID=CAMNT_0023420881 /DNA_START=55 /DNA_END=1263 /DNA_ORIENTATION=-